MSAQGRNEQSDQPVTRDRAEDLWTSVRARVFDPRAGVFGPSSISWKVNRESALFLGAGRAALLQLAHPWVATALDQHSNLRNDPLARFHNTFRVVFTMVFGALDQALACSRYLYQLHTRIEGEIPGQVAAYTQGSRYQANEIGALLWVYATLIESAVVAYESVLPPLSTDERETYYSESKTMAALFGIPASALPANWSAFETYNRTICDSNLLGVNQLSREMAHRILHGRGSWVPVPFWYRALSTAWLPERLRREFALPFGQQEREASDRARGRLPHIYRLLPSTLRFVGPYQEATARLHGRSATPLTRASNRFWMGQPHMMFPARPHSALAEMHQPLQ